MGGDAEHVVRAGPDQAPTLMPSGYLEPFVEPISGIDLQSPTFEHEHRTGPGYTHAPSGTGTSYIQEY